MIKPKKMAKRMIENYISACATKRYAKKLSLMSVSEIIDCLERLEGTNTFKLMSAEQNLFVYWNKVEKAIRKY